MNKRWVVHFMRIGEYDTYSDNVLKLMFKTCYCKVSDNRVDAYSRANGLLVAVIRPL